MGVFNVKVFLLILTSFDIVKKQARIRGLIVSRSLSQRLWDIHMYDMSLGREFELTCLEYGTEIFEQFLPTLAA